MCSKALGSWQKPRSEHTYGAGAGASVEFAATRDLLRAINVNAPLRGLRHEFRRGKALDQEHRAATMRALPYSPGTRLRLDGINIACRNHLEQLSAKRQ